VSISHTTRPKRPYETDGIHYNFVEKEAFESLVKADQFLEYALVFDNYYGTSRQWVEKQLAEGKDIILEIDWQGAQQVKKKLQNTINIFILPPTYEELKSRLIGRGDDEEMISHRMSEAKNELIHYKEYDFIVVNDDFDSALNDLKILILTMKHGYQQQMGYYDDIVAGLLNDS
jgi:guanylate kinase